MVSRLDSQEILSASGLSANFARCALLHAGGEWPFGFRQFLERHVMKLQHLFVASIMVVFLMGCATAPPPPLNYSVPNVGISSKKHDAEVKSINVAIARPEETTGKMYSNMDKTPALWKSALEEALNSMIIFSDEGSHKVNITVKILKFDPPLAGADMTTLTDARYEIVDRKTGDIIYTQNISSSATVPFAYSMIGMTRIIESVNRAVQNNITQFLQALESVDFQKPMFPAKAGVTKK